MNIKGYVCLLGLSAISCGSIYAGEAAGISELTVCAAQDNGVKMKEMKMFRKKYHMKNPKATDNEVKAAYKQVELMQLDRKDKYTVTGSGTYEKKITLQNMREIVKAVRALGVAAYDKGGEAQVNLELLLDYLSSQNVYKKFPKVRFSNYTDIRKMPVDLMSALSSCDKKRQEQLIEGVLTILEWDVVRKGTEEERRNWVSSDYLYNVVPHIYGCAVMNPNKEQGLKDMESLAQFLDWCTIYSEGDKDLLKPDGTGFHHKTHYNGYMYSYRTWVDYLYLMKGTSFRVSKEGYMRLKNAVVNEYLMAVRSKNDEDRCAGNSMAGRHPFKGMQITFTDDAFKKLIEIGGDVLGTDIDKDLAAYYNAFYMTDKYKDAGTAKLDGYYQYNYSPAGVYRKDNWVAVMRCPTVNFWGGELYKKTNRFGRYQSHGTLEIVYEGGLKATGYPADTKKNGAGWDWNMMPGSTTVHYTDWKDLLPNGNNDDRFDQWAKTTSFAGALSGGEYGLFAAEFDQADHWGSQRFVPTNLAFKKSVLAVDGILFSIGNEISAKGEYPDWITATNLFQSVINKDSKAMVVNGSEIKEGKTLTIAASDAAMILTPTTTGYYIPAGHDELVVKFANQESHASTGITGKSLGSELVAKAYINHGVRPEKKGYAFMVVPSADEIQMKELSSAYESGKLFEIAVQNESLHVLKYLPKSITAYTFFEACNDIQAVKGGKTGNDIQAGDVLASETELLILQRRDGDEMNLSVCNPNLRPKETGKKSWIAQKTDAAIVLKGEWKMKEAREVVDVSMNKDGNTVLKTTLTHGAKVDVVLVK